MHMFLYCLQGHLLETPSRSASTTNHMHQQQLHPCNSCNLCKKNTCLTDLNDISTELTAFLQRRWRKETPGVFKGKNKKQNKKKLRGSSTPSRLLQAKADVLATAVRSAGAALDLQAIEKSPAARRRVSLVPCSQIVSAD